ncbi:hypothetical protein USDA257_c48360 [Sinorhizobium fredii USDA 257]|uniref:Uncharacterized protein n=1 Tax=Sinorhizobium fredii (strain USDA 257) TaxID=1185652 RepID=I3XBW5_SINF2|nr:hypothetical protein USDA257_c48360 [Sinorhizobium fredii USDA 257]
MSPSASSCAIGAKIGRRPKAMKLKEVVPTRNAASPGFLWGNDGDHVRTALTDGRRYL